MTDFGNALRELEVNLSEIRSNLDLVRAATRLRPRLGEMLHWDVMGPDAKRIAQEYMDQNAAQASVIYRGMIVLIAGAFEDFVRRLIRDSVVAVAESVPVYAHLDVQWAKQNMYRSGTALATVLDPPHHVQVDYEQICINLGTLTPENEGFVLNAEAFGLLLTNPTPSRLQQAIARVGVQLNWDEIGRDDRVKNVLGESRTRDAAQAAEDYLDTFLRNRNRIAHNGIGGIVIADKDVEQALDFFSAFGPALANLVRGQLRGH